MTNGTSYLAICANRSISAAATTPMYCELGGCNPPCDFVDIKPVVTRSHPIAELSMENAHKRHKQPERVRRALLDQAAKLAVAEGLSAVTVQAVSDAAGVTKGGFIHHFPSKQALIDAVFHELLEAVDRDLDERILGDPEKYGSFTRAYVQSVFDMSLEENGGPWAPLSITMLTDPGLRALWAQWFQARLDRHGQTDGDIRLAIVRLAADGVWLADLAKVTLPDIEKLRSELLRATIP